MPTFTNLVRYGLNFRIINPINKCRLQCNKIKCTQNELKTVNIVLMTKQLVEIVYILFKHELNSLL